MNIDCNEDCRTGSQKVSHCQESPLIRPTAFRPKNTVEVFIVEFNLGTERQIHIGRIDLSPGELLSGEATFGRKGVVLFATIVQIKAVLIQTNTFHVPVLRLSFTHLSFSAS